MDYSNLSEKELVICKMLLEGKPLKDIAIKSFISLRTVKFHAANIYSKNKVTNRKELSAKALYMKY